MLALKKILFFFYRKLNVLLKHTFFKKNVACKVFCVYNVVLDTLILDFFSFSPYKFFQNTKSFFLYGMFMYALINASYFKNSNFNNNHCWIFLPNFKSLILFYIICARQISVNSGHFPCIFNARRSKLWLLYDWILKVSVTCVEYFFSVKFFFFRPLSIFR